MTEHLYTFDHNGALQVDVKRLLKSKGFRKQVAAAAALNREVIMTEPTNTAATKAGDLLSKAINLIDEAEYEGMPRDWLKRASELYEQARIITTQPSEPASAAEGAKTCAVCDGRGYIASYLIEGDRDERCPTCSAPDPAQSADK